MGWRLEEKVIQLEDCEKDQGLELGKIKD